MIAAVMLFLFDEEFVAPAPPASASFSRAESFSSSPEVSLFSGALLSVVAGTAVAFPPLLPSSTGMSLVRGVVSSDLLFMSSIG